MAYIKSAEGSFTPAITFGGGATGITYTAQSGSYLQVGNIIVFTLSIQLSNKGSSAGSALITGLPFSPTGTWIFAISANALTFVGMVNARSPGGTTNLSIDQWATAGSRALLTDTAFANTTFLQISGSYSIA